VDQKRFRSKGSCESTRKYELFLGPKRFGTTIAVRSGMRSLLPLNVAKAAVFTAFLFPVVAWAQTATLLPTDNSLPIPDSPPGNPALVEPVTYSVTIRTTKPTTRLDILSNGKVTLANCTQQCVLKLPAGDYIASLRFGRSEYRHEYTFKVEQSGIIEIEEANKVTLGLGIAATVVGVVALFGGAGEVLNNMCFDSCDINGNSKKVRNGELVMLAGAVLIPIGLVTAIRSRTKVRYSALQDLNIAVSSSGDSSSLWLTGRF